MTKKLDQYGEIQSVIEETMQGDGISHIKTGVIKIKMKVEDAKIEALNELVGVKKYNDIKFLVTLVGQRIGCFFLQ